MIKIALADDHALLNDMLAKIIGGFEGYAVTLQAANGKELIDQLQPDNLPDLVILDLHMPVMNGYETAHWLHANYPSIYLMVLTMIDSDLSTLLLLQMGVRGVLKKKMHASEIKEAIRITIETGYYFPHGRIVALLKPVESNIMLANNIMLTEREILFLKLACGEMTYKEIAAEMKLSPRTVENYRDSLFEKLRVKSRVGLVLYAIKNGLAMADIL